LAIAPIDSIQFDAIHVHSAPEALAQQIIAHIRSGKLAPGACLPSQRELARLFQVGLGSVREAVKILNVMGYLKVIPGKGTFISEDGTPQSRKRSALDKLMKAVSLSELMKAREVVECGAARMAAERADAESFQRLKEITAQMDPHCRIKEDYYQNDFAFHIAVAEASNNPAISEIVKLLVDKSHHHIDFMNEALGISMSENAENCVNTAKKVVFYIERGNGPESSRAMREHLNIVNCELEKEFRRQ
jgi:GntR family transcriptional repressor for pyruvate dehydrogenase complex